MDHSRIESTHLSEDVDTNMEASSIAREAAKQLQESRRLCQSNSVTVPTWTGRSGRSGVPTGKNLFGKLINPRLTGTTKTNTTRKAIEALLDDRRAIASCCSHRKACFLDSVRPELKLKLGDVA